MKSDYLSQKATVCIQHTTTHTVTARSMPPSESSMVKFRKCPNTLNQDRTGLITSKNTDNSGIVRPFRRSMVKVPARVEEPLFISKAHSTSRLSISQLPSGPTRIELPAAQQSNTVGVHCIKIHISR